MKRFGCIVFVGCVLGILGACSGTDGTGTTDAGADSQTVQADASTGETGTPETGTTDATAEASVDAASDAANDAATDAMNDASLVDAADAAPPPQPAVAYIGRWGFSGGEATSGYPASRMIVRFRGTAAEMTARDSFAETWLDITVDGGAPRTVTVSGPSLRIVSLAEALPMGDHVIEVSRRTEAFTGVIHISNVSFPGGGQLLPPPARKTRRVEIVANSTFDGYGVDGVRGSAECATRAVHNANRSMIPLLETALSAEVYAPSVSGTGILYNENPTNTDLISITYPRTVPTLPTPLWDFSTWQPDAVILVVGGTDLANPSVDPPPSQAAFAAGYAQFLAQVRSKNPSAHLFAIVSGTVNDDYPQTDVNGQPYMARTKLAAGINAAIATRVAAGDSKLHTFAITRTTDAELGACAYHPTFAAYQRMSAELAPFVKSTLGW